jgi:hypothetical protein
MPFTEHIEDFRKTVPRGAEQNLEVVSESESQRPLRAFLEGK